MQAAQGRAELLPAAGVADFLALLKPRVMTLVVFTGFAGLMLAPGAIHPFVAAVAVLCIAVGSGAAGALNMWYDRDIDARMRRTCLRPLPAGRMAPGEALGFGIVLAVGAVALMGLATNWVAAGLLAAAIAFYVFVYTIWLKRRTPQNIVIGGAAGAFPPMIGWAAVTGDVSLESAVLFLIIFLWTPPHFWALALYRDGDYARAGVPMLPVVAGRTTTRRQILLYTIVSTPAALAPWYLGIAGPVYGAGAAALSALFVLLGVRVLRDTGERAARQMFGFSILYLFLLFALMMVDSGHGPFGLAAPAEVLW
ncbi:MAG: protoheme IX farnesyltransferase [Rhodospirillaceae bacterium]|nr:protoheme IX farnesyltransferase [Rhodospirillaceae bacterium]